MKAQNWCQIELRYIYNEPAFLLALLPGALVLKDNREQTDETKK